MYLVDLGLGVLSLPIKSIIDGTSIVYGNFAKSVICDEFVMSARKPITCWLALKEVYMN